MGEHKKNRDRYLAVDLYFNRLRRIIEDHLYTYLVFRFNILRQITQGIQKCRHLKAITLNRNKKRCQNWTIK